MLSEIPQKPAAVCFDMNGHTLTDATRAFYVYDGVGLKIQDTSTEKTSVVRGYGDNTGTSFGGGTIFNKKEGIIDFYSGTITLATKDGCEVSSGGVVSKLGTFNMHGGTITGGSALNYGGNVYVSRTKIDDGNGGYYYVGSEFNPYGGDIIGGSASSGGNIFVQSGCALNVNGGNITGGISTKNDGNGSTIYVALCARA